MAALLKRPRKEDNKRNSLGDPEEFRLTLVEHLEELRDRLIKSICLLVAGTIAGWFLEKPLYDFLNKMVETAINPVLPPGVKYIEAFFSATAPLMLKLKLSFVIGLVISFPFLVLQLWAFIAPGLKASEQRPFRKLAPLSFLLFVIGASFAWFMMPATLSFFAQFLDQFPGTDLVQEAGSLAFFVLKMMLAFGVAFQLPLVVYILGALELLSAETLIKYWRQVCVAIFFLSMVITPSQDPVSMTVMAVPLVILFLISAYAVKVSQRRKRRAEELTLIDNEADEEVATYPLD
jgi:sec-independent protein translocase protein TatC